MLICCHTPAPKVKLMLVLGDAGQTHGSAKAGRRVYTVLPPPADYMRHSEKSSTLTDLENGDGAKDPSGKLTIISHLWSHKTTVGRIYSNGFLQDYSVQ